ncbi:TetR/AcrR family transcriptional regulator [Amycolatopsis xylanica]|uniref:TetR/AcrR family transcriptional regulator n=1 Tax=Amycolatopsis xylanica TaxID=589385 RepID=UPI00159FEABE|nr:TetR family transcriptional regulator [Amycolatopsis xylanica]
MTTPKRHHRERGKARRDALLRATVEVAAEQGTAGITHRAVTEKAGVPLATVSYFFDSITQLVEEALRTFTASERARLIELANALGAERRSPDEIAAAFAAESAPDRSAALAMFEAYLHAARGPELHAPVSEALAASRQVASAAARAAGAPDPDLMAPALAALAHGFVMHQLAVPGQVAPDALRSALRALFLGYLLDNGHVELALSLRASG